MVDYKGVKWYYYQGALLPKVAPHYEINLTKKEQKELLKISKAIFLRYTNEWDRNGGEFWYIIKDKQECLDDYNSNNRRKIRKGLKNCFVKKTTSDIIARDGYEVYRNAFLHYKTNINILNEVAFKKNILLNKNYDYWAIYKDDSNIMIAYSQNIISHNSINYSSIKFHPNYLRLYSSYALFFKMNEYYINKKKFMYVNDGARSISHNTNIQPFLEDKFHFRKAYCKLNIIYRWDIALIVKLLYPFRGLFKKLNHPLGNKIFVLLYQESIRRSFE